MLQDSSHVMRTQKLSAERLEKVTKPTVPLNVKVSERKLSCIFTVHEGKCMHKPWECSDFIVSSSAVKNFFYTLGFKIVMRQEQKMNNFPE